MIKVLADPPAIAWAAVFRSMTSQRQGEFERCLAESGLLLGEFMELVERAYSVAYLLREASLGWERVDLEATAQATAARLIDSYIKRKRLFILRQQALAWAKLAGAFPRDVNADDLLKDITVLRFSLPASKQRRLRARIHSRIEAIKGA